MLRRTFIVNKDIEKARIYICGLGYFELYVNGRKAGDEVLAPSFTRYDKRILYQTFDVTKALEKGKNAIGMLLGNGWYNCFTQEVWNFKQAPWRSHPKLLFQMYIKLKNGEEHIITSGTKWKGATGPIVFDRLRNGEIYDARLEKHGWTQPNYNDRDWKQAVLTHSPGGILHSQQMTSIRVTKTITPISIKEVRKGVWIYDLG